MKVPSWLNVRELERVKVKSRRVSRVMVRGGKLSEYERGRMRMIPRDGRGGMDGKLVSYLPIHILDSCNE